ncbi:MAG: hypothetical protein WA434_08650 [Candidatus Acidiferrales bacterium]
MKRFLGLAVLIFGLSIPAHGQSARGAMVGGIAGGALSNGAGGGGGYGGSGGGIGGSTSFHTLPSIPPARLPSTAVSGSDATFVPSTFLPYNQAIAAGEAILDAQHESVAEAAAKNSLVHRLPAKATIIENAIGNPVITTP